jgi:hypothetical protein
MSKKRRSAFVPRVIFGTMFVGVVPACALLNCGGDVTSGGSAAGSAGAQNTGGFTGVGAVAFGGFGGVAAVAFAGFSGAGGVRGGGFSVAAVAFGGFAGLGNGGNQAQDSGSDSSKEGGTDAGPKDSGSDSSG